METGLTQPREDKYAEDRNAITEPQISQRLSLSLVNED